jgi:hypothetical protein
MLKYRVASPNVIISKSFKVCISRSLQQDLTISDKVEMLANQTQIIMVFNATFNNISVILIATI